MAVVNLKSGTLTDLDADPYGKSDPGISRAPVLIMQESVSITSGDTAASTYRFIRVRSNWLFVGQTLESTDCMTAEGRVDVGLFTINGGAVIDANCLMDGVDNSDAYVHTNAGTVSAYGALGHVELAGLDGDLKRFWQLAGESSDPRLEYDIVATITDEDADANGTMLYTLLYTEKGAAT